MAHGFDNLLNGSQKSRKHLFTFTDLLLKDTTQEQPVGERHRTRYKGKGPV